MQKAFIIGGAGAEGAAGAISRPLYRLPLNLLSGRIQLLALEKLSANMNTQLVAIVQQYQFISLVKYAWVF